MGNLCAEKINLDFLIDNNLFNKNIFKHNNRIKVTNKLNKIIPDIDKINKKEYKIVHFNNIILVDDSIYTGELREKELLENINHDYIDINYKKFVLHGKGNYIIPNKYVFEGSFEHGYAVNGKIICLNDKNNYFIGSFLQDYAHYYGEENNEYYNYKGNYNHGLRCGEGEFYFKASQIRYKGNFKNDLFHSNGTLYFNDNIKIEAEFDHGTLNGYFNLIQNDTIIFKGNYTNGVLDKKCIINKNGISINCIIINNNIIINKLDI